MAGTYEYAAILCAQREHMARFAQILDFCLGRNSRANGDGTIMRRNSCGDSFGRFDAHRKSRAKARRVLVHHGRESQLIGNAIAQRQAHHATGMANHECHVLFGNVLGGNHQVAFVLAIFIIHHNHKLSFAKGGKSFVDGRKKSHGDKQDSTGNGCFSLKMCLDDAANVRGELQTTQFFFGEKSAPSPLKHPKLSPLQCRHQPKHGNMIVRTKQL